VRLKHSFQPQSDQFKAGRVFKAGSVFGSVFKVGSVFFPYGARSRKTLPEGSVLRERGEGGGGAFPRSLGLGGGKRHGGNYIEKFTMCLRALY
jgi:hypothetical protein